MFQYLKDLTSKIPSMGGYEIGAYLQDEASKAQSGQSIVELGTWLGAGTSQLALGVLQSGNNVEIHCYDLFIAFSSQIEKAKLKGVSLKENQDILPLVKNFLNPFNIQIYYHVGNILDQTYSGPAIKLYIDDACKTKEKFLKALSIFEPYFIPNKTIMVLMDYFYYEKKGNQYLFQKTFIEENPDKFKFIKRLHKNLSCAAILYKGSK